MKNAAMKKYESIPFLAVYLLFVLYITLFSRSSSLLRSCRLELFWSYQVWLQGNAGLGREILLNIILFVPLGFLLINVLHTFQKRRAGFLSIAICLLATVAIEAVQYFQGLGLCETDDVFNNVLGAVIGVGLYKLMVRFCPEERLHNCKRVLACLCLLAGAAGCNMIVDDAPPLSPSRVVSQFDFDITKVEAVSDTLSVQGYCRAYNRDTPSYQILLKGERTGNLYKTVTAVSGENFHAVASPVPEEKLEACVQFDGYDLLPSFTYIKQNRVEYVSGRAVFPQVKNTDLVAVAENGILKACAPDYDVYVYQFQNRLYWLIGSVIDRRTEIIFHLHTNEPEKLPARRKKYGFDNRGFRAGAKNEITKRMRCGKYRAFVQDIPEEYNVTAVTVGFNTGGTIQWTRCFRLAKQK